MQDSEGNQQGAQQRLNAKAYSGIGTDTNADDDTRYRETAEVAERRAKDPVNRMRTYLTDRGLLDDYPERRSALVVLYEADPKVRNQQRGMVRSWSLRIT